MMAHLVRLNSLIDFVKTEKWLCVAHFVNSSDTSDEWADKNQTYYSKKAGKKQDTHKYLG